MTQQQVGRLQGTQIMTVGTEAIPKAGPDDVVVRVAVCGICGTDLSFYRHGSVPSGSILGHEFCGRIAMIGERVEGLAIGDRVVVNPMFEGLGQGRVSGAFAQYIRISSAKPGRNIFHLPDGIPDEVAR